MYSKKIRFLKKFLYSDMRAFELMHASLDLKISITDI